MSKFRIPVFHNLELNLRDWIVIILSLTVFLVSGILFFLMDAHSDASQRGIVGTVIYRNRVAQRRNSSSSIWSDVAQKEQVRNFDSIRTDELAEAIITLHSGTRIELDPFSMIVLNIIDEEIEIKLLRGSLVVDPSNADKIKINRGKNTSIYFKEIIRIFGSESDLMQIFSSGSIEIYNGQESKEYLAKHLIEINANGIHDLGLTLETISPTDNSRYFVANTQSLDIQFLWKNENTEDQEFILSSDPFFHEILLRKSLKQNYIILPLYDGNYYWKIQSNHSESLTKRFKIKGLEPIQTISPADQEVISIDEGNFVAFSWKNSELAEQYKLLITKDPQKNEIQKELQSTRNGLSVILSKGEYFWKVKGIGSIPGSDTSSSWMKFQVVEIDKGNLITESKIDENLVIQSNESAFDDQKSIPSSANAIKQNSSSVSIQEIPLSKPEAIYPLSVVDMANKSRLVFRWKKSNSAVKYEFIFYEGKPNGKELLRKNLNTNHYVLNDLTILDVGNFTWEVKAYTKSGESISSGAIPFRIILSKELDAPVIE